MRASSSKKEGGESLSLTEPNKDKKPSQKDNNSSQTEKNAEDGSTQDE